MYLHRVRVALGDDGLPAAWDHAIVGQSVLAGTPFESSFAATGVDPSSVEGTADSPYLKKVPNHRVQLQDYRCAIPVLWWRSVGHSHTAFVMETLVDELARAAGVDAVEYRRRMLAGHPRHLGVLELAARKAGWGTPLPAGRARGVAVHESFGSYVAQVAEVSLEAGRIRVHRVTCAIDCGIAVNPLTIAAQMESGIAFGLGAALHGAITFKDGQVQQSNFDDYPVLKLPEMPAVEVHIVPSTERPGGVGEPGTPPIAPAVANALAALTGKPLRELPLRARLNSAARPGRPARRDRGGAQPAGGGPRICIGAGRRSAGLDLPQAGRARARGRGRPARRRGLGRLPRARARRARPRRARRGARRATPCSTRAATTTSCSVPARAAAAACASWRCPSRPGCPAPRSRRSWRASSGAGPSPWNCRRWRPG